MKARIYLHDPARGITKPQTIEQLYARILQVWEEIPACTLQKIRATYRENRIDKLVRAQGKRFENERIWIFRCIKKIIVAF